MTTTSDSLVTLKVEGLAETVDGLKAVDKALPKAVSKSLREFVKELQRRAEREGSSLGGVHRHAVKLGGIKPSVRGGGKRAGIRLASSKSPTVLGAEFGALAYPQFPRWRGNQWTDPTGSNVGYMLHPAMRDFLPEAEERLADEILEAIAREIEAL
jgi:hypothetical protein